MSLTLLSVAHIDKVALNLLEKLGLEEVPKRDNYSEELALIYFSRSAYQHNVDSRVKMGDYYYRGIGTEVDYDKAAACYRVAAVMEESPMAMWNLGWMYENGIGVAKDFHLAKRAYDDALTTSVNAYLPVKLSLIKLYIKYYWEWLIGGDVENELFGGQQQQHQQDIWGDGHKGDLAEEASAIKQAQRRKQLEDHDEGDGRDRGTEDELRLHYNKHKELEDYETLHGMSDDDGNEMMDRDDAYSEEDELIESLIILGICLLVGWLVYVRQFRFGGNNRNNQAPQQQQHPPQHQDFNRGDHDNSEIPPPPPQY